MKNQPSQPVVTGVTNTGPVRGAVRSFAAEVVLIRNWVEIIRQCAMVTAHGTLGGNLPGSEELLELLEATETAILTSVHEGAALLDRTEWLRGRRPCCTWPPTCHLRTA